MFFLKEMISLGLANLLYSTSLLLLLLIIFCNL